MNSPETTPQSRLSLTALFEREESPLLQYAFGIVRRRAVAEELVQEAFLQLHRHWEEVENPRAWVYRSVRNLALNHLRDHRREESSEDAGASTADERATPDAELGRMEAAGFLRGLVAGLEPDDRQLIELKYEQHLSYGEISRRTGLTVGNVGYRLHHLLKDLAESLRRAGIEGALG